MSKAFPVRTINHYCDIADYYDFLQGQLTLADLIDRCKRSMFLGAIKLTIKLTPTIPED